MMQHFAVISDVAGNLLALEAVLADIKKRGISKIICLGNLLGVGPSPGESIDRIQESCHAVLRGPFDAALLSEDRAAPFIVELRRAIQWNRSQLEPRWLSNKSIRARWDFLSQRPESYEENGFLFSWGSPRQPTLEYILDVDVQDCAYDKLEEIFAAFEKILFVGNYVYPFLITEDCECLYPWETKGVLSWDGQSKMIVNTGYVGRNSMGGMRGWIGYPPCYVELRNCEIIWHLVDYDVEAARQRARENPEIGEYCAEHLARGPGEYTHRPIWQPEEP